MKSVVAFGLAFVLLSAASRSHAEPTPGQIDVKRDSYIGCHFAGAKEMPFLRTFDGPLQAATILGCTYTLGAQVGATNQIPSRGGGTSQMPPLRLLDEHDTPHELTPPRRSRRK